MSSLLAAIHAGLERVSPPLAPFVPFSLFGIAHAVRITCAYRQGTKALGIDGKIGHLQAALFPVILIFSGTTVTSLLLGSVPGWVISPVALANYAIIPLIVANSPLLAMIQATPRLPREMLFSMFDGFSRTMGATTMGVDAVLSHPNPLVSSSPWTMVLIGLIAGGGGGLVVPLFRIIEPEWGFTSTPSYIKDGPGIDIWGAALVAYVYATLIDAHPFFRLLPSILMKQVPFDVLPKAYLTATRATPLLPASEAKVACSLLLGTMLCIRLLRPELAKTFATKPVPKAVTTKKGIVAKKSSGNLKKTQ